MARVRPATLEDHAAIMALRARYGMEPLESDEWRHVYAGSPVLDELAGEKRRDWAGGWVVDSDALEVVGFLGNIALPYELAGRRLVAAAMSSWVVDVSHRAASLLLVRQFLRQEGVDLFLNTTANVESSRALEALRIRRVPTGAADTCLYWITDPGGFAESTSRKRGWPLPALARVAGNLLRPALAARCPGTGATVETASGFDARFDEFWEELRGEQVLRLRRNRCTLEWAFELARRRGALSVLTHSDSGGRLRGYAILVRQDAPAIRLRRMRIVDLQVREGDAETLETLLAAALAHCRAASVHVLEAIGFAAAKRTALEALGARTRRLGAWRYYYRAASAELARELEGPELWDPCLADGDGAFSIVTSERSGSLGPEPPLGPARA